MAEISVFMTVFNAEPFLHESVTSLLHQDFTDWELKLSKMDPVMGVGGFCQVFLTRESRRHIRVRTSGAPKR